MDYPSKFRCTLCYKTRSLSTSGQSVLSIHTSGDEHKEIVEKRLNVFNKSQKKLEPEKLDSFSLSSTSEHLNLDGKINNNEVTYAEIRWVLKTIVSGFSMNSVDDVCDTFQKIFPDSDIATRMKLGRTKEIYIANFEILPHVLMYQQVTCLQFIIR